MIGLIASGAAAAALLIVWLRFPRTTWLFAASLATIASLVMRLVGADVAPMLSLLSVVALGVGAPSVRPISRSKAFDHDHRRGHEIGVANHNLHWFARPLCLSAIR